MSTYPCYENQETCERCHKPVEKEKAVWFELNKSTGEYCEPGSVPEDESQGGFAFGPDCAKAVQKSPRDWEYVGLAKANHD